MKFHPFPMAATGFVFTLACLLPATHAQAQQTITLDPPTGLDLQADTVDSKGNPLSPEPPNFRRLGEATLGQLADLRTLTLRFSQSTRVTAISVSRDFKIEQGGSCVEGNVYQNGATCTLLVRFIPQGPGNRLGQLTVSHSASATPDTIGIGGFGYAPVVSFIPSLMTTIPGTYPSGKGLLSSAPNLAIGGDTLYIADVGNSLLRKIDSTGTISSIKPFFSQPISIAVDSFGIVWGLAAPSNFYYFLLFEPWSTQGADSATYALTTCTPSAPCNLGSVGMSSPAEISIDIYNNLFMEEATQGALEMPVTGYSGGNGTLDLWHLLDQYAYFTGTPSTFAVNPYNDDLFTVLSYPFENTCYILDQALYGSEIGNPTTYRVAGGTVCGYSGDGGQATNAEISSAIGQLAFDAAGDLYFTDTTNQRVRRIDANTGIIRTIAGDGTAGYTCDGCGSTAAELSSPTGLAVDSQGQVDIISSAASGQVIRQITATGVRYLGSILKGAHSAPVTVIVTNTGNASLDITNAVFTGSNPTEFSIDPSTTSCVLTQGAVMNSGQTCLIGFVCTPTAIGLRSATFTITDNTVNNANVINVSCTGVLPSAAFKITAPGNGASFPSGTAVPFSVSVTSASGPAPTGTVQFKVDGAAHGSPVTISSGAASVSLTGLSTGSHTLSATYSGDTNYAAGGPVSVSITVTTTSTQKPTVSLEPLSTPAHSCGPLSFQAVVYGASGSVPTGIVQLMAGENEVASGSLAGGKALLSVPSLRPGAYAFTAHYGGDSHNEPAVSPALTQTVSSSSGCMQPAGNVQ